MLYHLLERQLIQGVANIDLRFCNLWDHVLDIHWVFKLSEP